MAGLAGVCRLKWRCSAGEGGQSLGSQKGDLGPLIRTPSLGRQRSKERPGPCSQEPPAFWRRLDPPRETA